MRNYIKKNLLNIIIIAFMLILPVLSLAQEHVPAATDPPVTIKNPLGTTSSIPALIKTILEGVVKIGMPILVLAVIYCGFLFVKAQGKPDEIKKAKDSLLYTLIGAAIILGSWAIAQLIVDTVKHL
jgi:Type IV secretion system pilin